MGKRRPSSARAGAAPARRGGRSPRRGQGQRPRASPPERRLEEACRIIRDLTGHVPWMGPRSRRAVERAEAFLEKCAAEGALPGA